MRFPVGATSRMSSIYVYNPIRVFIPLNTCNNTLSIAAGATLMPIGTDLNIRRLPSGAVNDVNGLDLLFTPICQNPARKSKQLRNFGFNAVIVSSKSPIFGSWINFGGIKLLVCLRSTTSLLLPFFLRTKKDRRIIVRAGRFFYYICVF